MTPAARKRARKGGYSHVGIILGNDVLDEVPPGEFFVLESTLSGRLGDGVFASDGHTYFGVQLRRLDELLAAYLGPLRERGALLGHASWSGPLPPQARQTVSLLWRVWKGRRYDANPIVLLSSICPRLRVVRRVYSWVVPQDTAFFCSELIATLFRYLDLLPPDVSPDDVAPMDLIGWGNRPLGLPYGRVIELAP